MGDVLLLFIWIRRLVFSSKEILKLENFVSLLGLSLAVMCLSVTMVIISSYETTLKNTLISHTGHITLISKKKKESISKIIQETKLPYIQEVFPFVSVEALAVSEGKVSGILLEAFSEERQKMNLKHRLIQGQFSPKPFSAVVGLKFSENMNLKIGSEFYAAVAHSSGRTHLKKFSVSGILDLGRYDLNSRYMLVSESSFKALGSLDPAHGVRLFLSDDRYTFSALSHLKRSLSSNYWIQDWKSMNENLFTAIQMEKSIIFVVLLILVVAASFNISNQMSLRVLRRFYDIGILKTMGAGPSLIAQLFLIQTSAMSFIGIFFGFFLSLAVCWGLFGFYNIWGELASSEVYKLNKIILDFKWQDFLSIFVFSFLISLSSTWFPIRKALRISPCEGLRWS